MGAVATESGTRAEIERAGELAELSDVALQELAGGAGDDMDERLATAELAHRDEAYGTKAAELRENAGEPVGPMPAQVPENEPLPPEDIIVAGIQMEMPNMGGKRPTSATLKFTGAKVKLHEGTALKKGTRIKFHGEAVVNDVGQKDAHDASTQQVVSAEQRHGARIVDLEIEVPQ